MYLTQNLIGEFVKWVVKETIILLCLSLMKIISLLSCSTRNSISKNQLQLLMFSPSQMATASGNSLLFASIATALNRTPPKGLFKWNQSNLMNRLALVTLLVHDTIDIVPVFLSLNVLAYMYSLLCIHQSHYNLARAIILALHNFFFVYI